MTVAPDVQADVPAATDGGAAPPTKRLIAMAAIAVLLGGLVVVTVLPGLAPPVPTRTGQLLIELVPGEVHEVAVVPREGEPYSFHRKGSGWFLVRASGEMEVPADRLDGFLQTLAGLTRLVEIGDDDVVPKEFGLDPPRAKVTLRDGKELSIAIGDRNAPLTALYVQVLPGTNIVLVGAVLLWEFDKLAVLGRSEPVEP